MSKSKLVFEASNLGPIAKARIDLRPLTVFVGHSNTGKSYMATMIYSILTHLKSCVNEFEYNKYTEMLTNKPDIDPEDMKMFKRALKIAEQGHSKEQRKELESLIGEKIGSAVQKISTLREKLVRNYNVQTEGDLIRSGSRKMKFNLELSGPMNERIFSFLVDLDGKLSVTPHIGKKALGGMESGNPGSKGELGEIAKSAPLSKFKLKDMDMAAFYFNKLVNDICLDYLKSRIPLAGHRIHYLPAARSTIMQLSTLVNHSIVENVMSFGGKRSTTQPTTGIISNFINTIDYIRGNGGHSAESETWDKLGRQLEDRILKGKVVISKGGGALSQIMYVPDGWNSGLPMSRTSSMVSELAPLVLYFRYILEPGDLLILEEPEAHVHPDAQLMLVKEISEVVSKGVKVILSTHSEWITEEIKSLIELSNFPEEERHLRKRKITALQKEDVGLWQFKNQTRGKVSVHVTEIKLDDGYEDLGFEEAYSSVTNDVTLIENRINDSVKSNPVESENA